MRPPDKAGPAWSAWKLKPFEGNVATLSQWVVHCPGLHAFWSYWLVSLIHLRAVEGASPADLDYADAEHEISTLALNPERPVEPIIDDNAHPSILLPYDVREQFHGVGDERAVEMLERFVDLIVAGQLAPDSDFRSTWKRYVWGTVEHLTTGHPAGSA